MREPELTLASVFNVLDNAYPIENDIDAKLSSDKLLSSAGSAEATTIYFVRQCTDSSYSTVTG